MVKHTEEYRLLEVGKCESCGGLLRDNGLGIYICSKCGSENLSEFGKVKRYIQQYGPSNAFEISLATGVSMEKIDKFLRQGRIEIPEGSDRYISCEECGADIRYGRYCPRCAAKLQKQQMKGVSVADVGEVPRRTGKMRYIDNDEEVGNKRRGRRVL